MAQDNDTASFDILKSFTHDPHETMSMVLDGFWDDDLDASQMLMIVYDLLHCQCASLALPFLERAMDQVDDKDKSIIAMYSRLPDNERHT